MMKKTEIINLLNKLDDWSYGFCNTPEQVAESIISDAQTDCNIPYVSKQRELLMAYERFLKNDIDQEKMHNAGLRAEAFLAINCS